MAQKLIRETLEQWEKEYLSPYAALSVNSKGRDRYEDPCDIRPIYQRDRDRILHSKAFRRLKDKTQVFLTPNGDHYRTRLTHTLEVSQNARTLAKALRLNEDLVEAIALGHDLGHTPFGHSEQSVRLVEVLEKDGQGLNLSFEVRDGIRHHQTSGTPATLEGKIVRFSDKIAYIHHDMDDSIRGGILKETDIPIEIRQVLGETTGERLDHMIHNIVINSQGKDDVMMSPDCLEAMTRLRQFLFHEVYDNKTVKGEEEKAILLVHTLYKYYLEHIDLLPEDLKKLINLGTPREIAICDYIASMSDKFAIATFESLYIPKSWQG